MLLFADDMVIMAESEEQSNLQVLSEAMGRWDLKSELEEDQSDEGSVDQGRSRLR